jgi:hypothetical protein
MNPLYKAAADWVRAVARGWDWFWFTPQQPHTLALIRILGGAMLFYTHLVWALDLADFFGPHSWLDASTVQLMNQGPDGKSYAWSYLFWIESSPALVWTLHLAALVVFAMLTVGLFSRVAAVLAWIITISYCNRATGAWYGLDQINAFMATYLMLGSCGAGYSVDRWLARRRGERDAGPSIATNIAVRLLQVHLCVIYLFGGIGKMRGENWWDGSAMWMSVASLEYQSLDLTWMVRHRWLLALLTHITVFWETFYCFLVWPKLTRPICLALAVFVHGGIALALGMKTFGLAMIIANLAFVAPELVRDVATWSGTLFRAARAAKSEIRNSKHETNSKHQAQMIKTKALPSF